MKITKIEKLASIITGDIITTLKQKEAYDGIIYRTGGDLEAFFRYFEIPYEGGTRHQATVKCLIQADKENKLSKIVNHIKMIPLLSSFRNLII